MKHPLLNTKFLLAHYASAYPFLYTGISSMLSNRDDCYTSKRTEILIDGFPRCANTYSTYAFQIAQRDTPIMAHHIHKQSQFIIADKYNIPSILLIREPIGCISSLIIRQPKYDINIVLSGYHFLYSSLLNYNNYVVGNFENILSDYASIINQLNGKFGSSFIPYERNDENEKKVKHIVQTQDELIGANDFKQRVAYPTEERKAAAQEIKKVLQTPMYDRKLKQCTEVYNKMIEKK